MLQCDVTIQGQPLQGIDNKRNTGGQYLAPEAARPTPRHPRVRVQAGPSQRLPAQDSPLACSCILFPIGRI